MTIELNEQQAELIRSLVIEYLEASTYSLSETSKVICEQILEKFNQD